ncbi:leader peptidase (prepilin peptidase) / N-methyltransferase [Asanoa hainanensis]|uniref:Leader peptidase (Prepilin peptidase) / N-methyltransferase n=1 Tax=Asanoa hainanensis TaxID=560556 RepID=A0A239NIS7_9ACTN|nr:prepilin peptidase [Asanoa hainanensis]SNT54775.1 leader peptidase (prepilin peptidase) / N-methyltransferase [Asanoa hainanensis]
MSLPSLLVAGTLGACWGAVLPGLIARFAVVWPEGDAHAPAWRRSCPHCGADRPRWWLASGKCPSCGRAPVPGRWLLVPVTALVCGVPAAAVGPAAVVPAVLLLAALAVPLAAVDLLVLRLPDPLVGVLFGGGLALLALAGDGRALLRAVVAAAACGAGYGLLALVLRGQIGFGDVKLGAALGLYLGWFGWPAVVAGVVLAPVVNLPLVIGLLVSGRTDRRSAAPFGPAMLAAALAAVTFVALR